MKRINFIALFVALASLACVGYCACQAIGYYKIDYMSCFYDNLIFICILLIVFVLALSNAFEAAPSDPHPEHTMD